MPLNMNTVGTGTGIGGGDNAPEYATLISPSVSIENNDSYHSVYIDNYSNLKSTKTTSCGGSL